MIKTMLLLFTTILMFGCQQADYSPKNITEEYVWPKDMDCSVIKVYSRGNSSEPTLHVVKCGKDKTINYSKQEGKVQKHYVIVDGEKYEKVNNELEENKPIVPVKEYRTN